MGERDAPVNYTVYHRDTAGAPEAHNDPGGPWYFQPSDYHGGEVYSCGYPTEAAAAEAALEDAELPE